jgi:iron complex outermembrane receptor protein
MGMRWACPNLKLTYSPGRWGLTAAVNNLFDEQYFTYAVRSTSALTPNKYNAYPLPGRTFWLCVQYTFN